MSLSGLCAICESRPATDQCRSCGTPACETHYDRATHMCTECAEGTMAS